MTPLEPSPEAVRAIAPTGVLRAAINLSNVLLVTGGRDGGSPQGVSPDLALALGGALGVEVELLAYPSPGAVADDATAGVWDVANIGNEPQRATHIDFSPAYAEIEATYLVGPDSDLTEIAQVDQPGRSVVYRERAAYGLWLERNLGHATGTAAQRGTEFETWQATGADALAGLRTGLGVEAERLPGARILDGAFTTVQQAVGLPKGRDRAGLRFLTEFVEAAKSDGVVAASIASHDVQGLTVAPPSS